MMTVLVHGFWGQPADWNPVLSLLPLHSDVIVPDLYEAGELGPHHSLEEWIAHFHDWIKERSAGAPVQLVGYSMGARLSLNAVLAAPELFDRVLLCSAGVKWTGELSEREEWEQRWLEKFQTQPWAELEAAWQEQPIFTGSTASSRRRSERMREMLGQSLINWSIRHHAFELEELKKLPSRVEWAYGALDQKYLSVAKSLQELPVQGQIHIIPNAGHRLPADSSRFLSRWILNGSET